MGINIVGYKMCQECGVVQYSTEMVEARRGRHFYCWDCVQLFEPLNTVFVFTPPDSDNDRDVPLSHLIQEVFEHYLGPRDGKEGWTADDYYDNPLYAPIPSNVADPGVPDFVTLVQEKQAERHERLKAQVRADFDARVLAYPKGHQPAPRPISRQIAQGVRHYLQRLRQSLRQGRRETTD